MDYCMKHTFCGASLENQKYSLENNCKKEGENRLLHKTFIFGGIAFLVDLFFRYHIGMHFFLRDQ